MANWEVTTAAARLEFDSDYAMMQSIASIDSTHFLQMWKGGASAISGLAQVFAVNTSTWEVTTAAARLEFETVNNSYNYCVQIDSNHFFGIWQGDAFDGFAQVFAVNTSTWAVTTAAARFEFDVLASSYGRCIPIDSNHFFVYWCGDGSDGFAQVLAVDTSTWAVTTAAGTLEFDTVQAIFLSFVQVDSNHFVGFWGGNGSDGFIETFAVNTSTWAVTTAAARLEFDTVNGTYNSAARVDSNHFIDFWAGEATNGYVQTFAVNTSTWGVSTAAARLEFDTVLGTQNQCIAIPGSANFLQIWKGGAAAISGLAQVFAVNTSTWAVTTAAARFEFDTQNLNFIPALLRFDTSHYLVSWSQFTTSTKGYMQVLAVEVPSTGVAIPIFTRQYRQRLT